MCCEARLPPEPGYGCSQRGAEIWPCYVSVTEAPARGGVGDPPRLTHHPHRPRSTRPRDSLTPCPSPGCQLTPDPGQHSHGTLRIWYVHTYTRSVRTHTNSVIRGETWRGRGGVYVMRVQGQCRCVCPCPCPCHADKRESEPTSERVSGQVSRGMRGPSRVGRWSAVQRPERISRAPPECVSSGWWWRRRSMGG